MAQRDKEETEFKVPETLILCANNCGHSGNPATQNMCQKCFQAAAFHPPSPCSSPLEKPKPSPPSRPPQAGKSHVAAADLSPSPLPEADRAAAARVRQVSRCSGCRKKVGLMGFRCRCGELFCAEHRYSDRHACSYDYGAAAREAIARENPVVKAAKIVRI